MRVPLTALLLLVVLVASTTWAHAAEVMPPKPARYFNDNANVVSEEAALRFNEQLAQFERDTSNQLVVAVFPKMESDSDIADYTQRVAQAWGVGQQDKRNGAVLFVFTGDRKMHVQVGYGLEGAIPDATAFDITERHIKPRFRANDYEGGLATGIELLMQAARGEYTGSGMTVAEGVPEHGVFPLLLVVGFVTLWIFLATRKGKRRRGYGYSGMGGPFGGSWSSGGSGGGWSTGSSGSGFSGGGGSFGGGGAGSSW
ncbi:hypothetical protein BH20VER1_BH20VER1_00780 [soil metagenome]